MRQMPHVFSTGGPPGAARKRWPGDGKHRLPCGPPATRLARIPDGDELHSPGRLPRTSPVTSRTCGFIGLVALVLASLPAAQAHGQGIVDRAMKLAAHVWNNPCGGHVTVDGQPLAGDELAFADPDECLVVYDSGRAWSWPDFCTVMLHEYGHLAGYSHPVGVSLDDGTIDHTHDPDPRSLMHPLLTLGPVYVRRRGRSHNHWEPRWPNADPRCLAAQRAPPTDVRTTIRGLDAQAPRKKDEGRNEGVLLRDV